MLKLSNRLIAPIALVALLLLSSMLGACRASDSIKQGNEGEFCNGFDDDCRAPLVCDESVCRNPLGVEGYDCRTMCEKLDTCESAASDCRVRCENTIRQWSLDAVEQFGRCIVDELTCEETREAEAHQLCYVRLDLPEDRQARCDDFLAARGECRPGESTEPLRQACYQMARTRSDIFWEYSDACAERIEDGVCADIVACFDQVFDLEPTSNQDNAP
ncbi:hypothetical protein FRC98_14930 [Lujinxingia vulgaris]|uniref:Uncharacterized protein n=1 Tax=Lujinxingia vulgaris TaxID=2600176 RepID=A0A5C6X2J1_9DELT|nr:hypothetical protein [Lujinxingia vulgaris]TXD35963.1 hypothetical protein FRC98_14930 [Lujinxingia vulgaris]